MLANTSQDTAAQTDICIHADLNKNAFVDAANMHWAFSPAPGVHRKPLERIGGEQVIRATTLVRYASGSKFAPHIHDTGEEFFVLDGVFSDHSGDFGAGTYVRNPPRSAHAPFSDKGCTIWVKLGQIPDHDRRTVRVDTTDETLQWSDNGAGTRSLTLYESADEHVALVQWTVGLHTPLVSFEHGVEIFVLKGSFKDEHGHHGMNSWTRLAPGQSQTLQTMVPCHALVKTGHLGSHATGILAP